jgi:serine protease Do
VPRRRERREGIGSGFFISADGYILTNNHVVKDAVKVKIITIDKKEYSAKIIGTDPKTDLALIKIDVKNFPFIELGDSNKVEVGEWVLAIGNPLGQDFTVTSGIISAEGRQLGLAEFEDFLQTDAAINMGNSGGPLLNMRGEAIGINSSILTPNQGSIGIGFSIPANMAKKVVGDLKAKGKVVRGWFGITMDFLTESRAKEYDIAGPGALVTSVEEGSPAAKAGLKRYDLIVEANGKKINSAIDLRQEIANSDPGDTVEVKVLRNNTELKISVKVSEAPASMRISGNDGGEGSSIDLGMIVEKNTPALARQYELKTSAGILVKRVQEGGVAAENRLQAGDVILGVNRTEITGVDQFSRIMSGKQPGTSVLMLINRYGDEVTLRFTLPDE